MYVVYMNVAMNEKTPTTSATIKMVYDFRSSSYFFWRTDPIP